MPAEWSGNADLQKASTHAQVRRTCRWTLVRPVAPRTRMANWEPSWLRT